MKRSIFTILLFLVFGAIVNVAVAWGCAFWVDAMPRGSMERAQRGASHRQQPRWDVLVVERAASTFVFAGSVRVSPPNPLRPGASQEEMDRYLEEKRRYEANESPGSWSEPASHVVTVPYWSRAAHRPTAEEVDRVRYSEDARGWPMRSLLSRKDAARTDPRASWAPAGSTCAIDLGDAQGPLGLPRVLPLRPIALGFIINTLLYAAALLLVFVVCAYTRRLMRIRRGRCRKCGYDLRGDLERGCPECGWGREAVSGAPGAEDGPARED